MTDGFRIERLIASHNRSDFNSGTSALDRYLRELATQDVRRRVSNCFVAVATSGRVAGYYTFAATSIPLGELAPDQAKRLPRYAAFPACLIGRLAVDRQFRGQGLGAILIVDAAARAMRAEPAIFALVVDAKDETAMGFYEHLGFRRFVSRPITLYQPLAEFARMGAGFRE